MKTKLVNKVHAQGGVLFCFRPDLTSKISPRNIPSRNLPKRSTAMLTVTANVFAMVACRSKVVRSKGRCHTDSEAVLPLCFIDVHIKTGRFLSVPVTKLHILPIQ